MTGDRAGFPPPTFEELVHYCIAHQDSIMVRESVDGHFDNYPLSALTFRAAMKHITRWLEECHVPHRALTRELNFGLDPNRIRIDPVTGNVSIGTPKESKEDK